MTFPIVYAYILQMHQNNVDMKRFSTSKLSWNSYMIVQKLSLTKTSKMNHAVKLNSYLAFVKEVFFSFLKSNLTVLKKKNTVSYRQQG